MDLRNLVIIFAPTLLRSIAPVDVPVSFSYRSLMNMVGATADAVTILSNIIEHYNYLLSVQNS